MEVKTKTLSNFDLNSKLAESPATDGKGFDYPVARTGTAAVIVQKVYRGYRIRRRLADSAVVAEQLWWQAINHAGLNYSTSFNFSKSETAVSFFTSDTTASRWNRARLKASKVSKGLSKDTKAQKSALQHWLQAIDPRHRYGPNLYLYYEEWYKADSAQPFFYWLDVGDGKEINLIECPRAKLLKQCIKYLGPKERENYECTVVEGKIVYKQTGDLLDTNKGLQGAKWIFVMSTLKKLYAGVKKKGIFNHSSFLAGGATLAAGRLVAEDGVLKSILPYSGHYRPTDDSLDSFLSFLKENGVNLNEVQIHKANEDKEKDLSSEPTEVFPTETKNNYKRTLSGGLQSPGAEVLKLAILQRINFKKAASSYQLGHQLSLKWSTGDGPRIGCVADYPVELRVQALEFVNLSTRVPPTPSASWSIGLVSPTASPTSDLRNGDDLKKTFGESFKPLKQREEEMIQPEEVDLKIDFKDLSSWELFYENVGEVVDSSNIRPIAKQVVAMCSHYPHAIILMARALRDVSDVDVWINALKRLSLPPASHGENLENIMVNVLKFSCECLDNDITRECFKHCVLSSENHEIDTWSLVDGWIKGGLIHTIPKGNEILKNLIDANLLESVMGGCFVKLQDINRDILVNLIILPEEVRLFLMRGGLGLTEPPKDEEWENAKEIYLMHNELSELPENPWCPRLSKLFLQRNYKLRVIPPSFFEYMPVLRVLNLSKTGIKTLPESLFRLVGLKRLFLNGCDFLMMLSPKVGELKHLEVFDLEGTEIIDLPKEIEKLTNLTCFEVSFYGYVNHGRRTKQSNAMIPCGVISALSQLEELNIDVNPDDERWNINAEAILIEICGLRRLNTLKFYFPRVELLRHLKWNSTSMLYPPLSHFRFIVGNHVKRIISRIPCDVEFELDRWDRCLKYINGEGVPGDVKKVLRHATAFYLDRHTTVKKLSEFGIENMEELKCCILGECNELRVIIGGEDVHDEDDNREIVSESDSDKRIGLESLEYLNVYYMKNLRRIWEGPVQKRCLILLKSLTLRTCPELTTIFTPGLLDNLCNLEELAVEDCPAIISLVSRENPANHGPCYSKFDCFFPNLKKISLHYMPGLVSISNGLLIAPKLEWMSFYNCPNLKSLSIEEMSSKDLKKIKGERVWWDALEWERGLPDYLDGIFVPIEMNTSVIE